MILSEKTKCIIIEDEPLAAELLADYIQQIDHLELTHVFNKAIDALRILKTEAIDLIFLDLHLPGIKGFDFLATLRSSPQVIVTTAYPEHALQSYEFNVLDYLVKPIEFSRFLKAINKMEIKPAPIREIPLTLKENRQKVQVFPKEILYAESQRDYLKIYLKDRVITTKMTLSLFEEMIPKDHFLRIHKSFIVGTAEIQKYDHESVHLKSKKLPIGRNYKVAVLDTLAG